MNKILVCFALFFLFAVSSCAQSNPVEKQIDSFEECVAAGNAVTRSIPAQCSSGGKTFRDTVVTPEIPNLNKEKKFCTDTCGNGVCEEIVCMAIGCPCPESATSCPTDCSK